MVVSAALRNQVERAAVPVLESFRIELIRVLPYSRIMHCPVNIQSKHSVFFELIAFIFEVFFHFTRQIRYEREEAADFLSEHVSIVVILLDFLVNYRISL